MSVRKGVFQVSLFNGSTTSVYDAWEIDHDGEKIFVVREHGNTSCLAKVYPGVVATESAVAQLFVDKENANPTVTFTTAMAVVPSSEVSSILDVYPRGSVYTTADTTFDPNTAWGGTWTGTAVSGKKQWIRTA